MTSQPIIIGGGISRKDEFTRAVKRVNKGNPIKMEEDKVQALKIESHAPIKWSMADCREFVRIAHATLAVF
jgi:hypothetical protein